MSSNTVRKYRIDHNLSKQTLLTPSLFKPLRVEYVRHTIRPGVYVWAMVEPNSVEVERTVYCVGDNGIIPGGIGVGDFAGTAMLDDPKEGVTVHVFIDAEGRRASVQAKLPWKQTEPRPKIVAPQERLRKCAEETRSRSVPGRGRLAG